MTIEEIRQKARARLFEASIDKTGESLGSDLVAFPEVSTSLPEFLIYIPDLEDCLNSICTIYLIYKRWYVTSHCSGNWRRFTFFKPQPASHVSRQASVYEFVEGVGQPKLTKKMQLLG